MSFERKLRAHWSSRSQNALSVGRKGCETVARKKSDVVEMSVLKVWRHELPAAVKRSCHAMLSKEGRKEQRAKEGDRKVG